MEPNRLFKATLSVLILLLVMTVISACAINDENTTTSREATAEVTEESIGDNAIADTSITLATTTSTENSGLLASILPDFEERTGYTVDVVAVGTGQALELGRNGDADVVLVHARDREDEFIAEGSGTERYDVMYNDFVMVGPEDDPVDLASAETILDALTTLANSNTTFVSRGDDSGTHIKELSLWAEADIEPEGDWYLSAGQGMGAVLSMTHELNGYTLTDRGTYIALKAEGLNLIVVVEGDEQLANPYGVIPVNPANHSGINSEGTQAFVDWLISPETQDLIANYKVDGDQLFFPDSEAYRAAQAE